MKKTTCWYFLTVMVIAITAGCGPTPQTASNTCGDKIPLAVLNVWNSGPYKDQDDEKFVVTSLALRQVLQICEFADSEVAITHDVSVSAEEVFLLAELYDEVYGRLPEVTSLKKSQQASLLFSATRFGSIEVLNQLLNSGIDAQLLDEAGNNVVSETVDSPRNVEDKISLLVGLGVSPIKKNSRGFSALDAAVLAENVNVVRQLLALIDRSDPSAASAVEDALKVAVQIHSQAQEQLERWLEQY